MSTPSPPAPGSLEGRVAAITGANSGIGREVARNLYRAGARVLMLCRHEGRAAAARADLEADPGPASGSLEVVTVDRARQASIRSAAAEVRRRAPALHVLVDNAAVWLPERRLTEDGVEETWATNTLAYLLLTEELLGSLRAGAPSRVVDVASTLAGDLDLDDLDFARRGYSGIQAYRQSKQANRMLAWRRAEELEGSGVTLNVAHPGGVATSIHRHHGGLQGFAARWIQWAVGKTPAQGAATPTWLASAPELEHETGGFYAEGSLRPCEFREDPRGDRLWRLCRDQLGL